jgi:hypothetical protein
MGAAVRMGTDTTRKKNKTKKIYMWEKKKQKYMDMYVRQYICV